MIDPDAEFGCRAWLPCPQCDDHHGCRWCIAGRTCKRHWRFLLASEGRFVFVQCPRCRLRWWHDTGFGAGGRPLDLSELPEAA